MTPGTEIAVQFGGVSINKSARLGITILRDAIPLDEAERTFCGKRITGKIAVVPPGEADQQRLPGMEDAEIAIEEWFDSKNLNVKPTEYTLGFTFDIESIDLSVLTEFRNKTGVVRINSVSEIDDPASDDDPEDDDVYDEDREAYSEGCEAATAGKTRRCPYKKGDDRRNFWLRGYDDTQVSGADMRQCVSCQTDYDGNEYEACPECESEHFVRLEASEAE